MKSVALDFFLLSVVAACQTAIPPGTILPVRLNSSLNSRKSKAGQAISARVMQDVPLSAKNKIPAGSRVQGTVISANPSSIGAPAQITFRFDRVNFSHHLVPVIINLRALASMVEVNDAQVPPTGPDRGTPWTWASRNLIGGEVAYGDGGPVARGQETEGRALADGVLLRPRANPAAGCRGEINDDQQPQAMWVFSSDACGLYDINDVTLTRTGRSEPVGQITLTSRNGNFNVGAGSGLLLRVNTRLH